MFPYSRCVFTRCSFRYPYSKWGGIMIKLSSLSPCLLYSVFYLTVLYVVCYQSVTSNSNNSSGYIYNRKFITQSTPISHCPSKLNFESDSCVFFSNSCFWWCYKNYFSEYNLCYLQSRFISKLLVDIF